MAAWVDLEGALVHAASSLWPPVFVVCVHVYEQGSLKDTFCPFKTWLFQHHHCQGNVQVYNVRIPDP